MLNQLMNCGVQNFVAETFNLVSTLVVEAGTSLAFESGNPFNPISVYVANCSLSICKILIIISVLYVAQDCCENQMS